MIFSNGTTANAEPLHVLDLPQLYQKPAYASLKAALGLLRTEPASFDLRQHDDRAKVQAEGIPKYLTGIIASPLLWIEDDEQREELWNIAGERLAERSGRSGMKDFSRSFTVDDGGKGIEVRLHEPAMTEDNIGFKTWSSSYVLANHLRYCHPHIADCNSVKVLELGAGTGLVGLAAAALWHRHVVLTDLPEIAANLAKNIQLNSETLAQSGASAASAALDWRQPATLTYQDGSQESGGCADIILVADPIYSPEHPKLLVETISSWLARKESSRVFLAHPIRQAYKDEIVELRNRLIKLGLECINDQETKSRDDWADDVTHSITIWRWAINNE